LKLELGLSGV